MATGGSVQVDPGASYLIVDIEPKSASATVRIDGTMQPLEDGQAMAFLPYGRHEYIVDAIGYGSESGTADVVRGQNTTVNVRLRSTQASLTVDTETPGATIKVNGQTKGTGSWSGQLSPGTYSIEASKDGHKPQTVAVTLAENDSRRVTVPALAAVYGGLNVGYRPIGSVVYIDGQQVGTTPYVASDITAGRHSVRVAKDGYDDFTTSVDVAEGQVSTLNGSLTEKKNIADIEAEIERLYDSGQYKQCYDLAMQNQDNPVAQYYIAICHQHARGGLSQNYTEAVKWYRKAAEQGHVKAQGDLGFCYYNGRGVTQNYTEAAKWFRKAAEQGNANAQKNLGSCYYNGEGVSKDYDEAVKWYRKAVEQGDAGAQYNLGICYKNGQGVEQSYAEAVKWYRKSAEQGHAYGQNGLGECYYYGNGVSKDYDEAVKWYRKSAEQGNDWAQYNLGWCYENGQGVPKNTQTAIEWYRKAVRQGNNSAKNELERLGVSE